MRHNTPPPLFEFETDASTLQFYHHDKQKLQIFIFASDKYLITTNRFICNVMLQENINFPMAYKKVCVFLRNTNDKAASSRIYRTLKIIKKYDNNSNEIYLLQCITKLKQICQLARARFLFLVCVKINIRCLPFSEKNHPNFVCVLANMKSRQVRDAWAPNARCAPFFYSRHRRRHQKYLILRMLLLNYIWYMWCCDIAIYTLSSSSSYMIHYLCVSPWRFFISFSVFSSNVHTSHPVPPPPAVTHTHTKYIDNIRA